MRYQAILALCVISLTGISILLNHASARLHNLSATWLLDRILLVSPIVDRTILLWEILSMTLNKLSLVNERLILRDDLALFEGLLRRLWVDLIWWFGLHIDWHIRIEIGSSRWHAALSATHLTYSTLIQCILLLLLQAKHLGILLLHLLLLMMTGHKLQVHLLCLHYLKMLKLILA